MTYSERPCDVEAVPAHSSCCLMVVANMVASTQATFALFPHRMDKTDIFFFDFPFMLI